MKKKVFNYSELHFSEVTCYKIHTLKCLMKLVSFFTSFSSKLSYLVVIWRFFSISFKTRQKFRNQNQNCQIRIPQNIATSIFLNVVIFLMKSFSFFNFSHLDFVTFEAGKLTKFFGKIAGFEQVFLLS